MKNNDAYLCGYYGMQNSGDDALMYAAAWGAQKFLNVQHLRVSSQRDLQIPHFGKLSKTQSASQYIRGQNRFEHYYSALRSRRVIFGGGSVLHNAQDINIKLDMMALSGLNGHLALGVGLGPFKNTAAEKACARFLNRCDFVGVRDKESYAVAKALAPDANVDLTFDLAPLLLCRDDFQLMPVPRNGIAFNLCPVRDLRCESPEDALRLKEIALTIERVWRDTGEEIYLLDINGHPLIGDTKLHQRLMTLVSPNVPVKIVEYDPNPLRLLQRMASYKAIVSMRLHGSILGFLAETPVLSLNYHSKCEGWCDQIDMPVCNRFDATKFSHESLACILLDGIQNGFLKPSVTTIQAAKLSIKNWRYSYANVTARNHSRYSAV